MVLSILPHRYLVKCEHGGVAFLTHIHSNRCIIVPMVMCMCQRAKYVVLLPFIIMDFESVIKHYINKTVLYYTG